MKAIEYFKNYKELQKTEIEEVALIRQLEAMFLETKEIQVKRKATTDKALISIFREINTKANSFVKMVNLDNIDKNISYKRDSFKLLLEARSPEFAKLVFK